MRALIDSAVEGAPHCRKRYSQRQGVLRPSAERSTEAARFRNLSVPSVLCLFPSTTVSR